MNFEPASLTLPAIQQAFRDQWDALSWLVKGQLTFSGRRLQKIGNAAVSDDALPLGQAKDLFLSASTPLAKAALASGNVRFGTFANRGVAGAYNGQLFSATDHSYVTWISTGAAWIYAFGIHTRTQAELAALAALLGANDAGYLVRVSTYLHVLKWTGAAWDFQDGDGSGYVAMGKPTGAAPNGGLWGLCDGTAYNCLNADGTLTSLTTQVLTGEVFLKGSTATAAQQAATRATWETTAKTDNESAHTHAVGTISAASAVTGITVDDHTTAADTTVLGAGVRVTTATHTVNDAGHTHTGAGTSAAGSAHQHVLSDATAQLKVFSEANGGLPLRISTVWYIRR